MEFPPGYRFQPEDGELMFHYLFRKINNEPLPYDHIIHDVFLYKHTPDELAAMFDNSGEPDWYFFTKRLKKYRNGTRPDRSVAGVGYWKLTGKDSKPEYNGLVVGLKKTLSYFIGKQPDGDKTNWKMHEFLASDEISPPTVSADDDMLLDEWVLCKIYQTTSDEEKIKNKNKYRNKNRGASNNDAYASTSGSSPAAPSHDPVIPPPALQSHYVNNGSCVPSPSSPSIYHATYNNVTPPQQFQTHYGNNGDYCPPPPPSPSIHHATNNNNVMPPQQFQTHYGNNGDYCPPPPPPSPSIHHATNNNVMPPQQFEARHGNNGDYCPPPSPSIHHGTNGYGLLRPPIQAPHVNNRMPSPSTHHSTNGYVLRPPIQAPHVSNRMPSPSVHHGTNDNVMPPPQLQTHYGNNASCFSPPSPSIHHVKTEPPSYQTPYYANNANFLQPSSPLLQTPNFAGGEISKGAQAPCYLTADHNDAITTTEPSSDATMPSAVPPHTTTPDTPVTSSDLDAICAFFSHEVDSQDMDGACGSTDDDINLGQLEFDPSFDVNFDDFP